MRTIDDLSDISDGRLYDIRDMVKADAMGCTDCTACCEDVGDLVQLNPFDVYSISKELDKDIDQLSEHIEMKLENKIELPHLKMVGKDKKCSFLNNQGWCSIHSARPNICRLFPLGRVYTEDDFKYFLQVGACVKPKLGKVKVKKWIGIENYSDNKRFILEWYQLVKALSFRLKFVRDEEELRSINDYLLSTFYKVDKEVEFYSYFFDTLKDAKNHLGII